MLKVGDKVRHPKMPEWGLGKVVEVTSDGKARIFFIHAGEKTILLSHIDFEKIEGEEASHPILDNPSFFERATVKGHRSLPDARLDFLKLFPDGFEDDGYLIEERNYKVAARELLLELLNEQAFRELLENRNFDEIVRRALQVANKTNLIFPNEKMGLKDGLKTPAHVQLFAERLFDLLYGDGEFRKRFEGFAACLQEIEAAKWTTMTYFPFLAFPEEHMFLKPEVTKHAAALTKAELNYRSDLNWLTYSCLLDFAKYLKDELVAMEMKPRDMIDVQSFMWCITPGKYN
ncbi:MAG: DUF3553 domain-containing protein [Deltaproteobacteria bacterium]|nr:DUF3553 domain-containing protein [Deltaproteobacteria bacterium]